MAEREIRYCTTEDGVRIAYCVEGDGPTTILALPVMIETFSLDHLMPAYQQFYSDLANGRRIIRVDWRGTGLSAHIPDGLVPRIAPPTWPRWPAPPASRVWSGRPGLQGRGP